MRHGSSVFFSLRLITNHLPLAVPFGSAVADYRQLLADKQVRFAGYMQPHPLENKIHIKVRRAAGWGGRGEDDLRERRRLCARRQRKETTGCDSFLFLMNA